MKDAETPQQPELSKEKAFKQFLTSINLLDSIKFSYSVNELKSAFNAGTLHEQPGTITIEKEAFDILKKRSDKLASIEAALEKAYATDEYGETGEDLCSIGESVCHIMGYL